MTGLREDEECSAPSPDAYGAADDGADLPPGGLDFSGATLVPRDAGEVGSPQPGARPLDEAGIVAAFIAHSSGEAVRLLPDAAAARALLLATLRAHHVAAGRPKRRELIVCTTAPLPADLARDSAVIAVPADDADAVRAAVSPRTAGILAAPLRLPEGLVFASGSLLAGLRELADEYGLALVFDETEGGLGRTGMAFAYEWTGVAPDALLVGEGAGLPLSALVLTAKLARATPAAPPPAPDAVAQAGAVVAHAFAPDFEGRVQSLGWMLEDRLASLRWRRPDLFPHQLGQGLVQGLACVDEALAHDLAARLLVAGLRGRVCGPVLAFLPPLTVTEAEIAAAGEILEAVVTAQRVDEVPAEG